MLSVEICTEKFLEESEYLVQCDDFDGCKHIFEAGDIIVFDPEYSPVIQRFYCESCITDAYKKIQELKNKCTS